MYRHLLVPLDDNDLAIETVGKAVNLARTLGARVSFVHVHDGRAAPVDGAADTRHERADALLAKAEAVARALGVPCDAAVLDGDAPHAAILAAARKGGCDLIFMAPRGQRAERGAALGAQTAHVLAGGELPVLVTSARNAGQAHPMVESLRDEHRALAAVLHAWQHLLHHGDPSSAADVELMRAMARYVVEFPLTLHHPVERDLLFTVLRGRTAVVNAELDELERQHERERTLAEALGEQVERYARHEITLAQLRDTVDGYAHFMWEHMGRVEGVILPVAQRCLTETDWNAIHAAATRPGGARANGEAAAACRQLFARMAHPAPQ